MRSITTILLVSTCLLATSSPLFAEAADLPHKIDAKDFDPATLIWHTEPAEIWEDALPVGNVRYTLWPQPVDATHSVYALISRLWLAQTQPKR